MQTSTKQRPTIKDMLKLPIYYHPVISPNGKKVAYTQIILDFRETIPIAPCYIYDIDSESTYQVLDAGSEMIWLDDNTITLIRHPPSGSPRWSDIRLIKNLVGEGERIGGHSGRVTDYTPFAKGFVFLSTKSVEKSRIGNFIHVEKEPSPNAVYYASTKRFQDNEKLVREYFEEEDFERPLDKFEISSLLDSSYHITSFVASPSTNTVYF
ncbi:MAG: hypothetical protein ACFE7R_02110, partial [Candidatus Hodarchaeota archaeon]